MVNARIKNKIKKMKTTLFASVLTLASLGTSAATNTAQQRNDKHADKIELTTNQKNMNDNLNSYFPQDGIKINGQTLAYGLLAAGIEDSQSETFNKFVSSFDKYMDEDGKITFENLNQVLKESMSSKQAQDFSNALLDVFQNPQMLDFTDEVAPKSEQKQEKTADVKTLRTDFMNVQYTIGEEGINYNGSFSMDVSKLLPPVYLMKNRQYKCGASTHFKYQNAIKMARIEIKRILTHYYILQQENKSDPKIQNLMAENQKAMEAYGLAVNENGNFYQKNKGNNQNNNIQAMQSTRAQSR